MTAAKPIRVAVIGAGPAARHIHLPILSRLRKEGELALIHICDLDGTRAASALRKFGFLSEGGDAVFAATGGDLDAVYIFGSAQMHYDYGLLALQHGKHLFVEKPVAPSFAGACALAAAAQARSLIAVGGHNRRFYKSLEILRSRAGNAGWRFAEAVAHKPELGRKPPFGARTWLTANGIHALDALVYMMNGLPETVASFAGDGDPPGTFSAVMRWKDGAQGVFLCDNNAGGRREEYIFHASGENCRAGPEGLLIEKDGRVLKACRFSIMDGFEAEHRAFLAAVRDGSEPRHAIGALAPSLFLAEQIERGFHGRLALPQASTPPHLVPPDAAILITGALTLSAPLTRLLSGYRLANLADLRAAPQSGLPVRAAILGRGAPPLEKDVLDKLPNLAAVGVVGLSLARHRPEDLLHRGIVLFNASASYAETVADFAFALAILGRRRAFVSHEVMRKGGWGTALPVGGGRGILRNGAKALRPAFRAAGLESAMLALWRMAGPVMASPGVASQDLSGASAGLIGWSANARALARRLRGAGVRVLVWSEHADAAEIDEGIPASLDQVLAADIVSIHRGLTPKTWHFLGAAELAKLRPGAVLINIARGALIEPQALLDRLGRGDVFACLDTYEDEPLGRDSALRKLPNVFLTSHIAGGSPDMHAAAAEEVVGKIAAWLDGKGAAQIDPHRLSTMT